MWSGKSPLRSPVIADLNKEEAGPELQVRLLQAETSEYKNTTTGATLGYSRGRKTVQRGWIIMNKGAEALDSG